MKLVQSIYSRMGCQNKRNNHFKTFNFMYMIKEVWKDIPDYPNYQVSNYGRVKSLKCGKEKILKQGKDSSGYLLVDLYKNGKGKTFKVHRLIALAFIQNDNPTEKIEINHLDENKENINYGTRNERVSKILKGKPKYKGEKRPMFRKHHTEETKQKISEAKRKPILQYTKEGIFVREWDSAKSASIELNISKGNITSCCKGRYKSVGSFIWKYK